MNKLYIVGYNEKSKVELSSIKNKISSIVKKTNWMVITDLVLGNITEYKDYAQYIKKHRNDKFEHSILKSLSLLKVKTIGIKVPETAFAELTKLKKIELDGAGNCVNCVKFMKDYEEECIEKIEEAIQSSNVFLLINDVHLRMQASKEYGSGSMIIRKFNATSVVNRPLKKVIP
jgi:hypothetical protein